MNAAQLVALLSALPADTEVFVWVDGERLLIDGVDQWDDFHADINVRGEQ